MRSLVDRSYEHRVADAVTVMLGGVGFFAAWMVKTYTLDPIVEQRKVIGEIDYTIAYIARTIEGPFPELPCYDKAETLGAMLTPAKVDAKTMREETAEPLWRLGMRLQATTTAIRWYGLCERCRLVLPRADVQQAVVSLVDLAMYLRVTREQEDDEAETRVLRRVRQRLRLSGSLRDVPLRRPSG